METKTSKRTIAIKVELRTNQNANTCAENAWENKTSKFLMSTRKKAWDAATGGKSRVGIKRGKKKAWCGPCEKMEPLPPLPAGVKDKQKGIGREQTIW